MKKIILTIILTCLPLMANDFVCEYAGYGLKNSFEKNIYSLIEKDFLERVKKDHNLTSCSKAGFGIKKDNNGYYEVEYIFVIIFYNNTPDNHNPSGTDSVMFQGKAEVVNNKSTFSIVRTIEEKY